MYCTTYVLRFCGSHDVDLELMEMCVRSYRRWLVRLRPSWRQRILPMSCKQFNLTVDMFFVDPHLLLLWEWFFISSFLLMQRIIRFKASESHILNANVFRRSAKTDAGLELFYNNLQLFHTACDQTQEFVVPIWTPLLFFHMEFLSVCLCHHYRYCSWGIACHVSRNIV